MTACRHVHTYSIVGTDTGCEALKTPARHPQTRMSQSARSPSRSSCAIIASIYASDDHPRGGLHAHALMTAIHCDRNA